MRLSTVERHVAATGRRWVVLFYAGVLLPAVSGVILGVVYRNPLAALYFAFTAWVAANGSPRSVRRQLGHVLSGRTSRPT